MTRSGNWNTTVEKPETDVFFTVIKAAAASSGASSRSLARTVAAFSVRSRSCGAGFVLGLLVTSPAGENFDSTNYNQYKLVS